MAFTMSDLIRISASLSWLDDDVRWIVRCDRHRDDDPPDDEAIQQASEDFRYEHDLLTAEEIEKWLAARELTLDDFQLHCERLAVAATRELDDPVEDATAAAEEAGLDPESWRIHLWLSDTVQNLARRCAWLLLAASAETGQPAPTEMPEPSTWRTWKSHFDQHRAKLLAGPKAARLLEVHRWPLTRVTLDVTEFADEGMAREAELCLSELSATMEEIVAGTGAEQTRYDCLVRELPEDWQNQLITLPAGSMRRLLVPDEPPQLMRVLSRVEPTLDDATVRDAVARLMQDDILGAAEQELISWEHPLLHLA